MKILIIILFSLVAVLFVLYVLSTRCSKRGKELLKFRSFAYAHRGLHDHSKPENSMAAFRSALQHGYGIELDVHLMKDGNLAVIHDSKLMRTTGQEGRIEDLETHDLWQYTLEGSSQVIPTFKEVLDLYDGQAPLIVELKVERNNQAALCEAACKMLDNYKGLYCLESFDPRAVNWLKKNRPDLIRGQLTENFFKSKSAVMPWYLKLCLTAQMFNFINRPDFVAYKFADRKRFSNTLVRKLWGAGRVTWTIQNEQDFATAKKEGWITIFENFTP